MSTEARDIPMPTEKPLAKRRRLAAARVRDARERLTSTTGTLNVSASGTAFSTSGVDILDSNTYEISFGIRMPTMSGTGVFVDPQRVLNGANLALGYPVSPGGFVTLFGSGLGPQTAAVAKLPFPTTLGGVTVTVNGKLAPLYLVAAGQISLIVPYSTTGSTATIAVTGVAAASGLTTGGQVVTVTGSGFSGGATPTVTLGGTAAPVAARQRRGRSSVCSPTPS